MLELLPDNRQRSVKLYSKWEGILHLAHCPAIFRAWLCPAQMSVPRCPGTTIWLGTWQTSFEMHLRCLIFCWTRSVLCQRWLSIDEIRDLTATLLTEVCIDVCIEPELQLVTDKQGPRSTHRQVPALISLQMVSGVVPSRESTLMLGYSILKPHQTDTSICNWKHEQIKKRAYEQRIRVVEHATFSPLVLSAAGQGSQNILQETSLQVGPHLQPHSMLATLLSSFLPSTLLHPGHQRCKIIMWTYHQNAHGGWPNQFWITSCITLNCYSVWTSLPITIYIQLLMFYCSELYIFSERGRVSGWCSVGPKNATHYWQTGELARVVQFSPCI